MIYKLIEDAVKARLSTVVTTGGEVVALPETEAELSRPFGNARVTVWVSGFEYDELGVGPMRSTSAIVQAERLTISVMIHSRFIRASGHGIYHMMEKVRRRLVGFQPEDCDKMYMDKNGGKIEREPVEDGGLFVAVMQFVTTRMTVEELDESSLDGPLIKKITTYNALYEEERITEGQAEEDPEEDQLP